MKLMTKEIEEKFKKYPLESQDAKGGDAKLLVKYFNPMGAGTWLITEGEKLEDGDFMMLSDLEKIKLPFGMTIERDLYLKENCTLLEAMIASGITPPAFLIDKKNKEEELEC